MGKPIAASDLCKTRRSVAHVRFMEEIEPRLMLSVALLNDVFPGSGAAVPNPLGIFKDRLYFFANDGVHGTEPWSTDGTAGGATLLKDLNSGTGNGLATTTNTLKSQVTSRYLFFNGRDISPATTQLWRTDGTSDGTIKLSSIGAQGSFGVLDDVAFFVADTVPRQGLWRSDGTPQGTTAVPNGLAITSIVAALDGVLYCVGEDATYGKELWRTDGTADGTYRLTDLNPLAGNASPVALTVMDHAIYFFADDATFTTNLYKYTVDSGVSLVKDINPGADDYASSSVAVVNGKFFFASNQSAVSQIWVSDGTADGTTMMKALAGSPRQLFAFNGGFIFKSASSLYHSDGTDAGTYSLGPIAPIESSTATPNFVTIGNYAYFAGLNGGVESIWRTDGNSAATMVADMTSNFTNQPSRMLSFNGDLYFSSNDNVKGNEFWTYSPDDPPLAPPSPSFVPTKKIELQFSHPLSSHFGRGSFTLVQLLNNGALLLNSKVAVSIDAPAGIIRVTFPKFVNGVLPDGNYQLYFTPGYIHDQSENPYPTEFFFKFFFLAGDADQNRIVDFPDLVAIAQHYGATTGATFFDGDFNGDGAIDFSDLVTIAQNYGKSLAPYSPPASPIDLPLSAPEILGSVQNNSTKSKNFLFSSKAPILPTRQPKARQQRSRN